MCLRCDRHEETQTVSCPRLHLAVLVKGKHPGVIVWLPTLTPCQIETDGKARGSCHLRSFCFRDTHVRMWKMKGMSSSWLLCIEVWLLVLTVSNEALDAVQWRQPILALAERKQS